jgi:hypothetical protein
MDGPWVVDGYVHGEIVSAAGECGKRVTMALDRSNLVLREQRVLLPPAQSESAKCWIGRLERLGCRIVRWPSTSTGLSEEWNHRCVQ